MRYPKRELLGWGIWYSVSLSQQRVLIAKPSCVLYSFLPSELNAAFLWAQLENLEKIQQKRKEIWQNYYNKLQPLISKKKISLSVLPEYGTNNAHMFFLICNTLLERKELITFLREKNIHSVFHYLSLHKSSFYKEKHDNRILSNSDNFTNKLVRLPLFYELEKAVQKKIIDEIFNFYK